MGAARGARLGGRAGGAPGAAGLLRCLGEQALQRRHVLVYGLEDRLHFTAHVRELCRELFAELAPRVAVGAGERRQLLDRAERAVPFVRGLEEAVAFLRVVLHARQGAADRAQGLVVQVAQPAPLHQPTGFRQAVRGLVEIELAPVRVVVGHPQLQVLHAPLHGVEVVTGQGVGTGSGHSAEGSRGHTHGEAARCDALGPAGAWPQFPERGRPVGAAAGPLFGHLRVRGGTAPGPLLQHHGLHGCNELGSLHHFDLGVQHWARHSFAEHARQVQQPVVVGRFGRCLGLLGRRVRIWKVGWGPILQGLGEGVRPPVRGHVRDHWRHLLSS